MAGGWIGEDTRKVEQALDLKFEYQEDMSGYPNWKLREGKKKDNPNEDNISLLGWATAAVKKYPDLLKMKERW